MHILISTRKQSGELNRSEKKVLNFKKHTYDIR